MADTIYLHDPDRVAGSVTLDDPAVQGGGGGGPQNVNIGFIDQSYQIFGPTIKWSRSDDFNHALTGYDATSGTPAIVSSPVRSGSGALEIDNPSDGVQEWVQYNIPAGNRIVTQSFYIRLPSLPVGGIWFCKFTGPTNPGFLDWDAGASRFGIFLGVSATPVGPVIEINRWYLVDIEFDTSTGTTSLKARINLGTEVERTVAQTSADITNVHLGGDGPYTAYFEDWEIVAADGVYPIGEHGFQEVSPGLLDYTAQIFAVTIDAGQEVSLGLIDQSAQIFAITTDATQDIALIDQTYQIFAATSSANVDIGFIDQSAAVFGTTIGDLTVPIGFIDQSAQIFAVTTDADVNLGFIDQSAQVFAVDVSVGVDASFIDNTAQIFAITTDADVNLALIDQSYVIFAVTIEQGQMITPDMIDQTYTMFNVSITPGDHPAVNIALIDQTYQIFGSTVSIPITYTIFEFIEWYQRLDACEDPNHDHYPHEAGYIPDREIHIPVMPEDWTPDDDELVDALE